MKNGISKLEVLALTVVKLRPRKCDLWTSGSVTLLQDKGFWEHCREESRGQVDLAVTKWKESCRETAPKPEGAMPKLGTVARMPLRTRKEVEHPLGPLRAKGFREAFRHFTL